MTSENQKSTHEEQLLLPFEMQDLPQDAPRSWELQLDGVRAEGVSRAQLKHEAMGITVDYGKRPEGYDGFIIREPGGAATVPYMIDENGSIYIGVVEEYRPTMGESLTKNIPRGFSDFKQDGTKETGMETAARELEEETGLRALGGRMICLAEGLNPNSSFFDYSHSPNEGVSIFAIQVKRDELELSHDDKGEVYYTFPAHVREQAEGDKPAERIAGSRFIPIGEALQSRDMFTSAAVGKLTGHLLSQGEYLVPQVLNHKEAVSAELVTA